MVEHVHWDEIIGKYVIRGSGGAGMLKEPQRKKGIVSLSYSDMMHSTLYL